MPRDLFVEDESSRKSETTNERNANVLFRVLAAVSMHAFTASPVLANAALRPHLGIGRYHGFHWKQSAFRGEFGIPIVKSVRRKQGGVRAKAEAEWSLGMTSTMQAFQDLGVTGAVVAGAYLWVKAFELLTRSNILDQKLSRKLVHITTGPLYMMCWPFFSASPWARYIAALVPMANGIRLLSLGLGFRQNEGVVKSMSRGGDPRELLQGPLYYVGVLCISTVCFWRESPVGMMALAMMCGGDGIADIIGRRFGSTKLPYNHAKSWAGSIAMFVAGFLMSIGSLYYFSALGFYELDLRDSTMRVALVSLAATVVESLPITSALDDNFIVPATVMLLGVLLFPV